MRCVMRVCAPDTVDDTATLRALEASLDDLELGRVDHERYSRDRRLGDDQVHERRHGRDAVDHAVVDVDINDLSAVVDLLARDADGLLPVAGTHQSCKLARASNVGSLANVDERDLLAEDQVLEA